MSSLLEWVSQLWGWITWGNDQLRQVAYYATMVTFLGVAWQLLSMWRLSRPVRIVVVNADDPGLARREIGRLPRRYVTRAEINGLVSQAAGGARLDFSQFRFDYKIRSTLEVALPDESYQRVVQFRAVARPPIPPETIQHSPPNP